MYSGFSFPLVAISTSSVSDAMSLCLRINQKFVNCDIINEIRLAHGEYLVMTMDLVGNISGVNDNIAGTLAN
jgi:hypothetical protein